MSPNPTAPNAAASASPQEQLAPQAIARKYISVDDLLSGAYRMPASAQPVTKQFDDIFHHKFMKIIAEWNSTSNRPDLTQVDRKEIIQNSYEETDEIYFGRRQLSERERKLRALTKLFYKVLSEEPWAESWIRAPDVERKLSRFELHKDSVETAFRLGVPSPRDAVKAAREALVKQQEQIRALGDKSLKEARIDRGPWDDIEIIYVPGTVSAAATSRLNRDATYPIAVSSVANTLHNHICREMVRPYSMAEEFLDCTDTQQLIKLHEFATDVCNYCPHLLDNDNVSLLVVLLILSRSDVCKLWDERGIRIEGSTISHRKAECMKNKLGWGTTDLRKPFDSFANEFQTRVKNAVYPDARGGRGGLKKGPLTSSLLTTPLTSGQHPPMYATISSPMERLMQVPVQIIPPTRLAEQNKSREPLPYYEVVGFPQLQAPRRLYPFATSSIPANKLEVPANFYRYTVTDVRDIYDAKSEQCKRHMITRPAPGRSLPAEDSPAHPLPPQPPFPLPRPSLPLSGFPLPPYACTQQAPLQPYLPYSGFAPLPNALTQQVPPRPSLPLSGFPPPPYARTQQAPLQPSLPHSGFAPPPYARTQQAPPRPPLPLLGFPPPPNARTQQAPLQPSLPLSGFPPPPNARTQQAMMQAYSSSPSDQATRNKRSLPSQDNLTHLQPPHKVLKWTPPVISQAFRS